MRYKVTNIDGETVKLENVVGKKINFKDVLIVKIPDNVENKQEFFVQLKSAFPDTTIVLTTKDVKFCRLEE